MLRPAPMRWSTTSRSRWAPPRPRRARRSCSDSAARRSQVSASPRFVADGISALLRQRQVERLSLTGRGVDDGGVHRLATVDAEGQRGSARASGDRIGPDDGEDVARELVTAAYRSGAAAGTADVGVDARPGRQWLVVRSEDTSV